MAVTDQPGANADELTPTTMTGAEVAAAGIDLAVETPDPGTNYHLFVTGTDEGAQKLKPRSQTTARELMREVGSVLRMSEAEAANLGQLPEDPEEDQTMIINMGPQHPSTHGVLRLMLELQGETVLRCKPIIEIGRASCRERV